MRFAQSRLAVTIADFLLMFSCSDNSGQVGTDGGVDVAAGGGDRSEGAGAGGNGGNGGGGGAGGGAGSGGQGPCAEAAEGVRCAFELQRCYRCPTECVCRSGYWSCTSTPTPCAACAGTQEGSCTSGLS